MIGHFPILAILLVLSACGRVGYEPPSLLGGSDAALPADSAPPDAGGLVDRGLLVRYFLREGVSGTGMIASTGDLDLPFIDGDTIQTEDRSTGTGVRFNVVGDDARACAPIAQGSISDLDGSTTGTIEVVADITAGDPARSRLAGIGIGSQWSFAFGFSSDDSRFVFSMNNTIIDYGSWEIDAVRSRTRRLHDRLQWRRG